MGKASLIKYWLRLARRVGRQTLRRAGKRKVSPGILIACILIGYVLVWGIYSYVSYEDEIKNKPKYIPVPIEGNVTEKELTHGSEMPVKTLARIAIILDDAGGRFADYGKIYSIESKFSISILPYQTLSEKVMNQAVNAGKEVMLHLPMEPYDASYKVEDGSMVLVNMPEDRIKEVVIKALDSLPLAAGINNHMGSKATSDLRVVTAVLETIKEKDKFFIDSRTSIKSVAYKTAKHMQIRSGKNEIFLDVVDGEEFVEERLKELIAIGKRKGFAIGIGHATRPATIAVMMKMMPEYEKQGIEFVFASSLVN